MFVSNVCITLHDFQVELATPCDCPDDADVITTSCSVRLLRFRRSRFYTSEGIGSRHKFLRDCV